MTIMDDSEEESSDESQLRIPIADKNDITIRAPQN
jgi:hypothetical protein